MKNDLTGCVFGRLTVLERCGKNKHRQALWLCQCSCGTQKVVQGGALQHNYTRSCGCLNKEVAKSQTGSKNPRWNGGFRAAEAKRRKEQIDSKCAVCFGTKKLCWDHDHLTNEYRGTLCDTCNRVVGFFKNDPTRFDRAAEYLRNVHT